MAKIAFDEVLTHLGHNYCDAPPVAGVPATACIRHIAKVFVPTGEVRAFCEAELVINGGSALIGCPDLWPDVNCPKCLELEGLDGRYLTKRGLMVDLIHNLMTIEQIFLDAMYWNSNNPDEEPINPDPDGLLALQWQSCSDQISKMLDRARGFMTRHGDRFGWPEDIEENGD
jgi:hypothetical protein